MHIIDTSVSGEISYECTNTCASHSFYNRKVQCNASVAFLLIYMREWYKKYGNIIKNWDFVHVNRSITLLLIFLFLVSSEHLKPWNWRWGLKYSLISMTRISTYCVVCALIAVSMDIELAPNAVVAKLPISDLYLISVLHCISASPSIPGSVTNITRIYPIGYRIGRLFCCVVDIKAARNVFKQNVINHENCDYFNTAREKW